MKFVVDFEKAKTTHTQTRVPARLISGWQGVDRRVAKGASQSCQPEKEHRTGKQERQSKPELSRCREGAEAFSLGLSLTLDTTRPWRPHRDHLRREGH